MNLTVLAIIFDYLVKEYCLTQEIYFCERNGVIIDWDSIAETI